MKLKFRSGVYILINSHIREALAHTQIQTPFPTPSPFILWYINSTAILQQDPVRLQGGDGVHLREGVSLQKGLKKKKKAPKAVFFIWKALTFLGVVCTL